MKLNTLLLIALGSIFSQNLFSQTNSMADIDKSVALIREGLSSCEIIEKTNTGTADTRFIYLKDGDVQLITVTANGKIKKHVEWFYNKGRLVYTETNWSDSSSLKPLFKEKTYHANGIMIAWLDNENSFVDSSSPPFKKLEKEINSYALKIKNEALE